MQNYVKCHNNWITALLGIYLYLILNISNTYTVYLNTTNNIFIENWINISFMISLKTNNNVPMYFK